MLRHNRNNLKMIKVSDTFLSHTGEFQYLKEFTKRVEVDGEIYTNTKREFTKTTFEEAKKTHEIYNFEYDFNELGLNYVIEDFNNCAVYNSYSENQYVARLRTAFENNFLDARIKSIHTCKTRSYDIFPQEKIGSYHDNRHIVQEICKNKEVNFALYDYGFNNTLYYSVSLETFVQIDYDLYPNNLKVLFKEFKNKDAVQRANYLLEIFSTKLQTKLFFKH